MKRTLLAVIALGLLAIAGCSKPPEQEMAAAKASVDAARAAEAEQYVPQSFRMVSDSLNAAMAMKTEQDSKFALFRSYGKSKDAFVRAEALGNKVVEEAKTEKEKVHQEVMGMMGNVKAMIDSANTALEKAPKGKDNKADLELIKNDLMGLSTSYTEAETDFNGGKYLTARSKFQSVMQRAQQIMGEIEAAAAKKGGMKAGKK
jgi:hypothetical protein